MSKLKLILITSLAFLLLGGVSVAVPVATFSDLRVGENITINDTIWNSTYDGGSPAVGQGGEDNETEKKANGLTLTEQRWDFEGIFLNREEGTLTVIGGVNFLDGPSGLEVGDLFVGHFDGYYDDANPQYGKQYIADYVFDFSRADDTDGDGIGNFQTSGDAVLRKGDFSTNSPSYVTPYSDPWTYAGGGDLLVDTGFLQYKTGLVEGAPFEGWDGVNTHYFLQVSGLSDALLDQLLTSDHNIFHMTLQCGNDAIRAAAPVPEPTTVLLSGLGLLGVGAFLRRKKRADLISPAK